MRATQPFIPIRADAVVMGPKPSPMVGVSVLVAVVIGSIVGGAGLGVGTVAAITNGFHLEASNEPTTPLPTPTPTPTPTPITSGKPLYNFKSASKKEFMKEHLTAVVDGGAKGASFVVGNAFTDEVEWFGEGEYKPGKAEHSGTYHVLMSMTKLLGGLTVAKAFEEGIFSPDDDISKYIPEFAMENLKYYRYENTSVKIKDSTTPITIRDLLQMRGGFTYDLYALGNSLPDVYSLYDAEWHALASAIRAQNGVGPASKCEPLNNAISFGKPMPQLEEVVAACATMPLYHEPGRLSRYGIDYDVLGAVLSEALRAKGHSINAPEYAKAKILDPIGASRFYMSNGELPIPSGGAENISTSTIKRSTTLGIDDSMESYEGVVKWLSDVPGDKWNLVEDSLNKDTYVPNRPRAGAFGAGGIATFVDYAKLLKLVANRGVYDGKRIMSEIYLNRCVLPANSALDDLQYFAAGNNPLPDAGDYNIWTSCGAGVTSGGAQTVKEGMAFPYVGGFVSWSGYYGTSWMVDMNSGMYAVGGIQATGGERGGIPVPDVEEIMFRMSQ